MIREYLIELANKNLREDNRKFMEFIDFIAVFITLVTFFLLINVRYLKPPSTIGLRIMALNLSLFIIFGEAIFSASNFVYRTKGR